MHFAAYAATPAAASLSHLEKGITGWLCGEKMHFAAYAAKPTTTNKNALCGACRYNDRRPPESLSLTNG